MRGKFLVPVLVGIVFIAYGEVTLSVGGTTAKTRVESVTILSGRALVERVGRVKIPAGESVVSVEYLPQGIDPNSVRVSGKSEGKVILGGVEILYQRWAPDTIRKIKDAIQRIKDQLAELKVAEDGLKTRRKFVESVAGLGGSKPDGESLVVTPQNLSATASFIERELDAIASDGTKISRRRRELSRQLDSLNEILANMTGGSAGRGYQIKVPVEAKAPATLELRIKYAVSNATWQPRYDARYDESTGKVKLSYWAVITQRTSEDWEDAKIVLSTTQAHIDTRPPELSPWYLSRREEISYYGGRQLMALPPMEMAEEKSVPKRAEYEYAAPQIVGENVVFNVPGRKTIPSDGQKHQVMVAEITLDASKKFVTVPKINERVYLTARCKNSTDYLLLPGEVAVFQGNDFVGTQRIDAPVAFGEEFDIAMGPVKTIKVERKRTKRFRENTGIIGQNVKISFGYEIKVSNNSRSEAEIEVVDQLPVSEDEDISVENIKFEPQPSERDRDFPGQLVWKVKLKPGESKKIRFEFSVKYPKDLKIQGL
ncbi:MAG: hypothetical protein DRG33_03355 [Deltaproteobacteria bacterium]|nr:MAG: hypothetical protein DRG33_03355 [Deltaproteobacteria bacterium]